LPRQEALLRVEKAYFRSASRVGIFAKGMPVVFYVSGEGNGAIASARITSSKTLAPDEAAFTYTRQGVLSKEDLRGLAKGRAHIHAFTFDNLIPFKRKIGFRRLRDLSCVSGAGMVTAEPLSHASLEALMAEGAGGKR
jgi:hypothetical protein